MDRPIDLVVPTHLVDPQDLGGIDLYRPQDADRPPVVLLVHGLFQQPPPEAPRRSRFFRAYAAQLAQRGVAAVVLDHELTDGMRYAEAADTVRRAVAQVRDRQDVDPDRVGTWFFSGGGPLAYPWMADRPDWLRCVALTYPLLPTGPLPGWPDQADAVRGLGATPVVLTLVEHEIPDFVAGQQSFLASAPAGLETIRVAGAGHGFDVSEEALGEGDPRRTAVERALDAVAGHLTGPGVVAEGLEPPTSSV